MAAPHVAGAVALYYSLYPDASHMIVKEKLLNSVSKEKSLKKRSVSGGRLNVMKFIE